MTTQRRNQGRQGRASRAAAAQRPVGIELPVAGAIGEDLAREVEQVWFTATVRAGRDVGDFTPSAPLTERLAWATARGMPLATVLAYRRHRDLRAVIAATTESAATRTEPEHRDEDSSASEA